MSERLTTAEVSKSAQELRLYLQLEQEFLESQGRPPSDREVEQLLWRAEVTIWGPAGCGHCKSGRGCKRES